MALASSSFDRRFAREEAVLWLRVLERPLYSLIGLSERGIRMPGPLEVAGWRRWETRYLFAPCPRTDVIFRPWRYIRGPLWMLEKVRTYLGESVLAFRFL